MRAFQSAVRRTGADSLTKNIVYIYIKPAPVQAQVVHGHCAIDAPHNLITCFYDKKIRDFVGGLKDSQKPSVYMEWGGHDNQPGKSYGNGSSGQAMCDFAGARNIASKLEEFPAVESEWVIVQNPEYIIEYVNLGGKWGWNSTEEAKAEVVLMANRTGWSNITAVKDGRVYVLSSEIAWGLDSIALGAYMSKWFHPGIADGLSPINF
jgi:iron complex transport system substrate-binding protein